MHEIRVSNFAVKLNSWQFSFLFFLTVSGLGFLAAGFMILLDILRWAYQ